MVDAGWEQMRGGATDAEVIVAVRTEMLAVIRRFFSLASDATLVEFQALLHEELKALRERDPQACVELISPSGHPMSLSGALPPELVERELALMAKMLREADPKRAIKPSEQTVRRVAAKVAAGMTAEQLNLFSDLETWRHVLPAKTCDAVVAYSAAVNAIPVVERGRAIRVLQEVR